MRNFSFLCLGACVCLNLLAVSAQADQSAASISDQSEEALLVVASKLPSERASTGAAVSVLSREDIEALGSQYAVDLLRHLPGVAVARTGGYGGFTQIRTRGAEANHTLVLIDGVEVSGAGTGEFDFASLLAADIERIEVLRGAQSGLYGSNALAGVIDIRTRSPAAGIARIAVEGGENGSRQASVSVGGVGEHISSRLNYTRRESKFDLSIDDSTLPADKDKDRNDTLSGQLGWQLSQQFRVDLNGRYTDRVTETDGFDFNGGPQQGLAVDDASEVDTEDLSLAAMLTMVLLDGRWTTRIRLEDTDTESDGVTFGNKSERRQYKLDSSWSWNDEHRTTAFVEHETERFRNLYPFDPSQVPTQERDIVGYGLEHRWQYLDRASINLSFRRDENDDFRNVTSFAINSRVALNDMLLIHASVGKGITNPTFFEQFGFTPSTFVGNPDLEPETSVGWDLGATVAIGDQASIDVTYFNADLEDEIVSVFPTAVNATGESKRKGMEISASVTPNQQWSLRANYTYTDATQDSSDEPLRPQHRGSVDVQWLADERWQVAGSAVYNGSMYDNDFRNFFVNGFQSELSKLDRYVLVNAQLTFQVSPKLSVHARVENLFDETYQEVLSYASPGRAAFFGMRLSL